MLEMKPRPPTCTACVLPVKLTSGTGCMFLTGLSVKTRLSFNMVMILVLSQMVAQFDLVLLLINLRTVKPRQCVDPVRLAQYSTCTYMSIVSTSFPLTSYCISG